MAMTLRALQYFSAVAESGSISSAAHNLTVSQATITESIQSLEAHLSALLFERHARGMALTHAGHEFRRHSQRIMAAVASAEQSLSMRPDALAGDLVIGTTDLLTGYYLPSLLERYRRAFPNVRVHVYEDTGYFIEHQLINGEIDVALTIVSTLETPTSFDTTVLVRSPWRLWLSARHRLTEFDRVSIANLRGESFIELRNEELERMADDIWRNGSFLPEVAARTRSVEATRNFVATRIGVSLLPQVLFRPWSLDGEQLVALPLIESFPPLEIGVASRRGTPLSSATKGFLGVAREHRHATARRES